MSIWTTVSFILPYHTQLFVCATHCKCNSGSTEILIMGNPLEYVDHFCSPKYLDFHETAVGYDESVTTEILLLKDFIIFMFFTFRPSASNRSMKIRGRLPKNRLVFHFANAVQVKASTIEDLAANRSRIELIL